MPNTSKQSLAAELVANLPRFTGSETYIDLPYPWLLSRLLITDGTKYLAEKARAFWLLDAIASHQLDLKVAGAAFQVWELIVNADQKAVLTCRDGNETMLARQEIPHTDFPLEHITLYASRDDSLGGRVVMLTSEY